MKFRKPFKNLFVGAMTFGPFHSAVAQDSQTSIGVAPYLSTIFPIFYGIGGKIVVNRQFDLGLSYGIAPESYYSVIGTVAAEFGDKSSYKDVIEAAFQNNSIWLAEFHYNFESSHSGFFTRLSLLRLSSSGTSNVDTVLQAATGKSHELLKDALIAVGRTPELDIEGTLHIGEIAGGYHWELTESVVISVSVGIGKVLSSQVNLKTDLPHFEATEGGNRLMRSSESELESIVTEYGLSPTLGLSVSAFFGDEMLF